MGIMISLDKHWVLPLAALLSCDSFLVIGSMPLIRTTSMNVTHILGGLIICPLILMNIKDILFSF